VAIDVPLFTANPPPGIDELMSDPGAKKSVIAALFENSDTRSVLVVELTVTAVEMQPGKVTASVRPSLPAAMTVATPRLRKASTDCFKSTLSQAVIKLPPPRLMFTDAIREPAVSEATCCSA